MPTNIIFYISMANSNNNNLFDALQSISKLSESEKEVLLSSFSVETKLTNNPTTYKQGSLEPRQVSINRFKNEIKRTHPTRNSKFFRLSQATA